MEKTRYKHEERTENDGDYGKNRRSGRSRRCRNEERMENMWKHEERTVEIGHDGEDKGKTSTQIEFPLWGHLH